MSSIIEVNKASTTIKEQAALKATVNSAAAIYPTSAGIEELTQCYVTDTGRRQF